MISIYTTPMCGKCKQLKSFCSAKGIEATLVDITEDTDARARLLAANKLSVPVVEKDGQLYSGSIVELQELVSQI